MTLPRTSTTLSILALGLGVTVGLSSCVDDNADSALIILRAVTPDASCMFSATDSAFLPSGIIQADSVGGYLIGPEVRNDLTLLDGEAMTPKTVFVNGAEIEIRFYDEDLFDAATQAELTATGVTRFFAPFTGAVDPNGGTAVFPFEAVPDDLLRRIGAALPAVSAADPRPSTLLDVRIRMTGTRGGSSLESNLFRFPVEVCANCARDILGPCDAIPPNAMIRTGGACRPLQDGVTTCCTGADPDGVGPMTGPLVCPARAPEM